MGRRAEVLNEERVAELAMAFPEVVEDERWGHRTWSVGKAAFAWVRPFSKADLGRFGDAPVPQGTIVALATDDLADKEAVLSAGHAGVFTIEHFDGYAAVLVELEAVDPAVFDELLEDAWLAKAPKRVAAAYLDGRAGT